jgi:hypothetical protein
MDHKYTATTYYVQHVIWSMSVIWNLKLYETQLMSTKAVLTSKYQVLQNLALSLYTELADIPTLWYCTASSNTVFICICCCYIMTKCVLKFDKACEWVNWHLSFTTAVKFVETAQQAYITFKWTCMLWVLVLVPDFRPLYWWQKLLGW